MSMTLTDMASIYLEEAGISGDAMIQRDTVEDGGAMFIHDLMAGFVEGLAELTNGNK